MVSALTEIIGFLQLFILVFSSFFFMALIHFEELLDMHSSQGFHVFYLHLKPPIPPKCDLEWLSNLSKTCLVSTVHFFVDSIKKQGD